MKGGKFVSGDFGGFPILNLLDGFFVFIHFFVWDYVSALLDDICCRKPEF